MNLETAKSSIERYLRQGIKPGSCLEAVLRNQLIEAFSRADPETQLRMGDIVFHVYNECPRGAIRDNVDQWLSDEAYRCGIMAARDEMEAAQ